MGHDENHGGRSRAPDACTLPASQRPLRAAAFNGLFAEALRGLERVGPTLLRLDLQPGRRVAGRAAELAAAETECCSFFTFALTVTGGGLVLDVTVPPSRAGALDGLARQAAAGVRG